MNAGAAERIVVTGANRGIGLELTRQALARGDHVVAACRDPVSATELQALGKAHRDALEVLQVDVTDDATVAALVTALDGRAVDVLVNNAGVSGGRSQGLDGMDYDGWADALSVNTLGPFRVTVALLPALRRSTRPRVLTVTSLMGSLSQTSTGSYAYRSSKAAANKVTQVLAAELAGDGIVVAPVHPGWVRTDMGGPEAPVGVEESAAGLLALADRLTPGDTGRFLSWNGETLPW